jgi:hypothetical protein
MMKRLLYIFVAAMAVLACNKPDQPQEEKLDITGDWHLSKVEVKAAIGNEKVDVYLRFKADNSFEMYQMLGTGRYRVYEGSWRLTEAVLSGSYSDGKAWGASYDVAVNGNTLTLTSKTSSPETDTYSKTTIPQTVIETAE